MKTSMVTLKGQIVIPAEIRRKLELKKGNKVAIIEQEGGFLVRPLSKQYFEQFAGILPDKGKATSALLEERRKEQKLEDARPR
ncbi:MAG: AbrB/MazE/SpoVT family DNA-binding domain-containing protein [Deltaproteobacteria bacterium]|nr:AbrB/MazE/SpoVT family DNA-binding domain-containing protein [Deltaproteobacteria bacterium]